MTAYATKAESPQLTQLLADANDEAFELARDATDSNAYPYRRKLGRPRVDARQSEGPRRQFGPHHRNVVEIHQLSDRSVKEVAELAGLSVAVTKFRLLRARIVGLKE